MTVTVAFVSHAAHAYVPGDTCNGAEMFRTISLIGGVIIVSQNLHSHLRKGAVFTALHFWRVPSIINIQHTNSASKFGHPILTCSPVASNFRPYEGNAWFYQGKNRVSARLPTALLSANMQAPSLLM
eukprot:1156142-Pelagomonas_calceolata.AAC.13